MNSNAGLEAMIASQAHFDCEDVLNMALPAGSLRVLQITDTHLYADPKGELIGIDTLSSMNSVLATFRHSGWPIDFVLATGDLVHDASPRGYRRLARTLDEFGVPVYCLPGNHDLPEQMRLHLLGQHVSMPSCVDVGAWRIVLLNSVREGEVNGHLADSELSKLREALEDCQRPTLVSLHHHPVSVGSGWIDKVGLDNSADLLSLLDTSPQVRGVLCGHVHQRFDAMRESIRIMATPSTCVQFAPNRQDFAIDHEPPGFRLLALTPQGVLHSSVLRNEDLPVGLQVGSAGYD